MRVRIDGVGEYGLVTDITNVELPNNAWTQSTNVRFSRGAAKPFSGFQAQFAPSGTVHYLIGFDKAGTWTVCYPADTGGSGAAESIFSYDGSSEVNRTRTPTNYTAATSQWNGCFFQGV